MSSMSSMSMFCWFFVLTLSKLSMIVANTKFSEKKEPKITRKTKKKMARYSI